MQLLFLDKDLEFRVLAPELLKFKLTFNYKFRIARKPHIKVVIVKAPKLDEISVPENVYVSLGFCEPGVPKIFEKIAHAQFQGFPNLIECHLKLYELTSCPDLAIWLDELLYSCPNLRHLTLLLKFKEQERRRNNCFEIFYGDNNYYDFGNEERCDLHDHHDHKEKDDDKDDEEECDDGAEIEDDMRLNFALGSLMDLDIELAEQRKKMQIKVACHELLKLELKSNLWTGDEKPVEKLLLEVEAPKLLEMSSPRKTRLKMDLHRVGLSNMVGGVLNAKWKESTYELTQLQFGCSCKHNADFVFPMFSGFWTLRILEPSDVRATPTFLRNKLLTNLPLLESLLFFNCILKKEVGMRHECVTQCKITKL